MQWEEELETRLVFFRNPAADPESLARETKRERALSTQSTYPTLFVLYSASDPIALFIQRIVTLRYSTDIIYKNVQCFPFENAKYFTLQ